MRLVDFFGLKIMYYSFEMYFLCVWFKVKVGKLRRFGYVGD